MWPCSVPWLGQNLYRPGSVYSPIRTGQLAFCRVPRSHPAATSQIPPHPRPGKQKSRLISNAGLLPPNHGKKEEQQRGTGHLGLLGLRHNRELGERRQHVLGGRRNHAAPGAHCCTGTITARAVHSHRQVAHHQGAHSCSDSPESSGFYFMGDNCTYRKLLSQVLTLASTTECSFPLFQWDSEPQPPAQCCTHILLSMDARPIPPLHPTALDVCIWLIFHLSIFGPST